MRKHVIGRGLSGAESASVAGGLGAMALVMGAPQVERPSRSRGSRPTSCTSRTPGRPASICLRFWTWASTQCFGRTSCCRPRGSVGLLLSGCPAWASRAAPFSTGSRAPLPSLVTAAGLTAAGLLGAALGPRCDGVPSRRLHSQRRLVRGVGPGERLLGLPCVRWPGRLHVWLGSDHPGRQRLPRDHRRLVNRQRGRRWWRFGERRRCRWRGGYAGAGRWRPRPAGFGCGGRAAASAPDRVGLAAIRSPSFPPPHHPVRGRGRGVRRRGRARWHRRCSAT